MSLKYLNLSGLEDLWINIKNYILSKIPTKTSELTNDSGYLTSHQSLDNYVTLDTSQTISAIKVITGSNQGKMVFKNPNYTKGDAVESSTVVSRLYFGNGASYAASNGILTFDITSSGNTSLELAALNNTASNSNRASLIITYDKSATRPRLLKSWGDFIPNSNNGYSLGNASNIWKECYSNVYYLGSTAFGDIVTHNASEFLTSHQSLSNYVNLNGVQTISGAKTFTSDYYRKDTGAVKGTAPSSNRWQNGVRFTDNNNVAFGGIERGFLTDRTNRINMIVYKGTDTSTSPNAQIGVGFDGSGNPFTYAPTPATGSNDTNIATTAFVKAQGYLTSHQSLANYVTTNTVQDIESDKNFKGLITTIPNATLWTATTSTTNDITYLGANAIHVEQKGSGKLTDLSNGAWSVAELGVGCFFFRINNGTDIRYKHLSQNTVNRIPVVSGANRFMNDVTPNADNTYSLGSSSLKWKNAYINNLILNGNTFDPTSIDGIGTTKLLAYEPASTVDLSNPAGTSKPGSALYDIRMNLINAIGNNGVFDNSSDGTFSITIDKNRTQSGTWKVLHYISSGIPSVSHSSFPIAMWVRIA